MGGEELGNAKLMVGACFLPKRAKKDKPLGEDAYFIAKDEQTIGVADGVGGYAKHGIDSGVYARELMKNASEFVDKSGKVVDPKTVLNHAYENSKARGASTACIITVRDDNTLRAVNIGDSRFLVIRAGEIVYRSRAQQYSFNCPFQLERFSRSATSEAEEMTFEVKHGDVIVVATDGLFDNLYDDTVRDIVKWCLQEGGQPDDLALVLGKIARKESFERTWLSPFAKEAIRNGMGSYNYMGGKYDDVTVIVGYVYQSPVPLLPPPHSSSTPPVPAHYSYNIPALVSCLLNIIVPARYLWSWYI